MSGDRWVLFTKRTNDPKLAWLEKLLAEHGIPSMRDGESTHAPILKVERHRLDDAWEFLTPEIDETPDDHEMFQGDD